MLQHPARVEPPWERASLARLQPAMSLADPALDDTAGQQVSIAFNPASAERLFAGSGHTFAEPWWRSPTTASRSPASRSRASVRATVTVERPRRSTSDNVAGKLVGSDPALRDEYVVLSGHLDHLGVGGAVDGDRIYNGAMDNASGIASLIETAAALARAPEKPKRSVLFVAVTAEEKGLLGSRYFATHPTVPAEGHRRQHQHGHVPAAVPDEERDGVRPRRVRPRRVGAAGRARRWASAVQGDPEPLRNRFIRSDQYSFIRQGVPALALKVGYAPDSADAEDRTRPGRRSATTRRPTTCSSPSIARPPSRFNESAGAAHRRRRQSAAAPALERHAASSSASRRPRSSGSGPPRVPAEPRLSAGSAASR